MTPIELLAAVVALVVAVAAGTVLHELSHAAVLLALGVPCDVEWLPDRAGGSLGATFTSRLAAVTPRPLPADVGGWRLRLAAMTPLTLALPFVAVVIGAVPDPVATGSPPLRLAVVGWLACALPSPQDFSVLFHADEVLQQGGDAS